MDIFGKSLDGLKRGAEKFGGKIAAKIAKKAEMRNGFAPKESEPYGLGMGGADTEQESQVPTQALNGYTKRAWRRDDVASGTVDEKNVGKPGVGRIGCPCGNAPASMIGDGKDVHCPCGRVYDSNGWILKGPELDNAIPPAHLRQQNKLDFLKRELPLSQDAAEREAIESEIATIEAELASLPAGGDADAREEKDSTLGEPTHNNSSYGDNDWEKLGGDKLREVLRSMGIKDAADISYKYWKDVPEGVKVAFKEYMMKNAIGNAEPAKDKNGAHGYISYYKGKQYEVYADSQYGASKKLAAQLGLKSTSDVSSELAEKDVDPKTGKGTQVTSWANAIDPVADHATWKRKADEVDGLQKQILEEMGKDKAGDKSAFGRVKELQVKVKALMAELYNSETLRNEDSSALGFQSAEKSTTAQRADYPNAEAAQSKCLACGHESPSKWNGKCESCGVKNEKDASSGAGRVKVENSDADWAREGNDWAVKLGKAEANNLKYDDKYNLLSLAQQSSYIQQKFAERKNAGKVGDENIIEWPQKGAGTYWLVKTTNKDGSFTPLRKATKEEWQQDGSKQAQNFLNASPCACASCSHDSTEHAYDSFEAKSQAGECEHRGCKCEKFVRGEKQNAVRVPSNFPVQPLKPGESAKDKATCGTCGLSWDDGKVTSMTPAPGARCPFEEFHGRSHNNAGPGGFEYKTADTSTVQGIEEAEKLQEQGWKIIQSGLYRLVLERPRQSKNAGHLGPVAWDAASLEERVQWLEAAKQDINQATRKWPDLSADLHVALQDVHDMPSTVNNAAPEFEAKLRDLAAKNGKSEAEMRAMWKEHEKINQGYDQSPTMEEFVQWNHLKNSDVAQFTVIDKDGNEIHVNAQDAAQALRIAAKQWGIASSDLRLKNDVGAASEYMGTDEMDACLMNDKLEDLIGQAKTEFAKIDRIPDAYADKLMDIVHSASDEALQTAIKANIKFVTPLARNEASRRGLKLNSDASCVSCGHPSAQHQDGDPKCKANPNGKTCSCAGYVSGPAPKTEEKKNSGALKCPHCSGPVVKQFTRDQGMWCENCWLMLDKGNWTPSELSGVVAQDEKKNDSDVEEIERHIEGIEHEVGEMQEEGLDNAQATCAECGHGDGSHDGLHGKCFDEARSGDTKAVAHPADGFKRCSCAKFKRAYENAAGRPCPSCESTNTKPAGGDMKESLVCQDCQRTFYDTDSGYHPEHKNAGVARGAGKYGTVSNGTGDKKFDKAYEDEFYKSAGGIQFDIMDLSKMRSYVKDAVAAGKALESAMQDAIGKFRKN